ncbi:MAG TPA: PilZ domain-containing protein [Nitrospiraceae bacterium]|nr:PilZ domain-containing protein [Nitrospiraceae bacterium]
MSGTFQFRTHNRMPITCFVDYVGEGLSGTGVIQDFSVDGWHIKAFKSQLIKVGMSLALRVNFPNQHMPIEIETALVQWVKRREFGVHVVGMSSEVEDRVRQFIESMVNLRHAI